MMKLPCVTRDAQGQWRSAAESGGQPKELPSSRNSRARELRFQRCFGCPERPFTLGISLRHNGPSRSCVAYSVPGRKATARRSRRSGGTSTFITRRRGCPRAVRGVPIWSDAAACWNRIQRTIAHTRRPANQDCKRNQALGSCKAPLRPLCEEPVARKRSSPLPISGGQSGSRTTSDPKRKTMRHSRAKTSSNRKPLHFTSPTAIRHDFRHANSDAGRLPRSPSATQFTPANSSLIRSCKSAANL